MSTRRPPGLPIDWTYIHYDVPVDTFAEAQAIWRLLTAVNGETQ